MKWKTRVDIACAELIRNHIGPKLVPHVCHEDYCAGGQGVGFKCTCVPDIIINTLAGLFVVGPKGGVTKLKKGTKMVGKTVLPPDTWLQKECSSIVTPNGNATFRISDSV